MNKRKKKTRLKTAGLLILLLLALLAAAGIGFILKTAFKSDKKTIEKKDLSSQQAGSLPSETESLPEREIDISLLKENFTYYAIPSSQLDSGLLSSGGIADESSLQPVYNSLFTLEGLQIASLEDASLKCSNALIKPLNDMLCAFYERTGLRTILIKKAYEPYQAQSLEGYDHYDEYGNYLGYYADETPASPCAEHENGVSIDLALYDRDSGVISDFQSVGEYQWFENNAFRYGFILRYGENKQQLTGREYYPAHFRYVGVAAAKAMHDRGLCLEEFNDVIKGCSFDSPMSVNTESGLWLIYYIADSGLEVTQAQIPTAADGQTPPFEISGNSSDGYIICVKADASLLSAETDLTSSFDTNG